MKFIMENKNKFNPKKLRINPFHIKKIFFIVLFKALIALSLQSQYNFNHSFLYSNAITLINENIFIIHKSGVDIYDSSLTKKIKTVINFNEDEIEVNDIYVENSIPKIFENTITCIINDKIYIFNSEGEILYNSDNKISLFHKKNYILIPIKIINNNFYYMIGYINENNNNIQLLFFKFEINTTQNNLLYNKPMFNYNENDINYKIKYKLLTCQLMHNASNKEKIICFYYIKNYLEFYIFDIENYENFTFIIKENNKIELPMDISKINIINSATNLDNSKMFIFLNSISGKGYYFSYSINSNTFSTNIEFISNCYSQYFGTKLSYFRETNQFLFGCINENNNLLNIVIFNNNFEYLNNFTIKDFNYNSGYSIVYSYFKEDYIIISDKQYQEINFNLKENFGQEIIITDKIGSNKNITLRKTEETNNCGDLQKCLTCNEESISKNLCIKCNNDYYPINSNYFKALSNGNSYVDCYKLDEIPKNYYFDTNTNSYEPCYYTCSSCNYGGDGNVNNCTRCAKDYTEEPEKEGSTNCVVSCKNFYYYTSYGQYKCSSNPQCPEEKNLLIREKKKCVDNCTTDDKYRYQYSGECFEQCPPDTINENFICKVKSKEVCSKSLSQFDLYDFLKEGGVEKIAKTYAKEFGYTDKHISLFKNEVYSIMLYKSSDCIIELQLSMPEIDFGSCYIKVQEKYEIKDFLLVAIIDKMSNKKSNPITSYSFYNPYTGEKLDSETACKEEVIVVKENIKSLLNDSVQDMDSIIFLTEQNIDVFNKTSGFYTDLCYHYESPCDKDVALRDRLLIYYPNITLCDSGCNNAGVNLTSMTAICECKYKEMADEDEDDNSNLYQSAVNEVFNIFNQINIEVMACYKDLFDYDYFISCTGGLIILSLIFVQFIDCIIYFFISYFSIQKYMYNMTENYLLYLNKSPMYKPYINKLNDEEKKSQKENFPPKKNKHGGDVNINIFNFHSNKNQNVKIKKIDGVKKKIKSQEGLEDKNNSKIALYNKKKKEKEKPNSNIKVKLEKSKSLLSLKKENSNSNSLVNTLNAPKNLTFFDNYLSTHLNEMLFNDALIKDKRLFFEYFCDKLKKKQVILELFLIDDPIKPKTLKLLLLILDLEVCFVINGMFINEDYISKLFHSTKEENFISFLPRSINRCFYTIIASILISYIVGCFFVQERRLKSIFKYENNNVYAIKYEVCLVMREIKWRYNIFILLTAVISAFSWYYISCFNNVYPHMKMEWIKSSIFIILLVHILSILVTLVEALLRFISFEIKSEKMYKASGWLG